MAKKASGQVRTPAPPPGAANASELGEVEPKAETLVSEEADPAKAKEIVKVPKAVYDAILAKDGKAALEAAGLSITKGKFENSFGLVGSFFWEKKCPRCDSAGQVNMKAGLSCLGCGLLMEETTKRPRRVSPQEEARKA